MVVPKFRLFDKNKGNIIDSSKIMNINFENKSIMVLNKILEEDNFTQKDYSEHTFKNIVLMQSTGLKDKNDKEIFEGDILAVETDDEVINVRIFWDEKHALFMFESKKYNENELLAELVEDNTYPFEIIGNIYEDKELLDA
ncbi:MULTISPECIES: YopX family protein [Streptococcus]|uniref:YopX family protein n=1 Tax=Streptococcus TaxID=1301 RepID=UPI001639D8C9|nr:MULTISPECIES: YopX family protein [Streptococcus]